MFDREGTPVHRMGRRGRGPGEGEEVIGMALAGAGPLWLMDGALGRYTTTDLRDLGRIEVHDVLNRSR